MILIGKRVRIQLTNSDGALIRFTAPIVRETNDTVTVDMPAKARKVPFPLEGGARFVKFPRTKAVRALDRAAPQL